MGICVRVGVRSEAEWVRSYIPTQGRVIVTVIVVVPAGFLVSVLTGESERGVDWISAASWIPPYISGSDSGDITGVGGEMSWSTNNIGHNGVETPIGLALIGMSAPVLRDRVKTVIVPGECDLLRHTRFFGGLFYKSGVMPYEGGPFGYCAISVKPGDSSAVRSPIQPLAGPDDRP
jgi:hypothetical protein